MYRGEYDTEPSVRSQISSVRLPKERTAEFQMANVEQRVGHGRLKSRGVPTVRESVAAACLPGSPHDMPAKIDLRSTLQT